MLFVLTTKSTVEMVPTIPGVVLAPGFDHLDDGSTRLVPSECCASTDGAPKFQCRALSAVEFAEVLAISKPVESNKELVRRGLVSFEGLPSLEEMTAGVIAIVAQAIVALTQDPAAFARPTLPA